MQRRRPIIQLAWRSVFLIKALFHCSTMKIKEGRVEGLFSRSVVVTHVSKEMAGLMKTLRDLFQCGLASQSSTHTSLKR